MIKMIAGVFGLSVNGLIKPMDKNSEPFRASAEQEARLVALGMAQYMPDPDETASDDHSEDDNGSDTGDIDPVGFDEMPPEDDEPELPEGVTPIPEYSTENTAKELREIAELCGLTFKSGMTKSEMVAALDAHIAANMVDGVEVVDDDAAEDDGEPAPTFDASEAVM